MIVFTVTEFDEIRIVKAETIEKGVYICNGFSKMIGSIPEDIFKAVIDDRNYVVCVPLTSIMKGNDNGKKNSNKTVNRRRKKGQKRKGRPIKEG